MSRCPVPQFYSALSDWSIDCRRPQCWQGLPEKKDAVSLASGWRQDEPPIGRIMVNRDTRLMAQRTKYIDARRRQFLMAVPSFLLSSIFSRERATDTDDDHRRRGRIYFRRKKWSNFNLDAMGCIFSFPPEKCTWLLEAIVTILFRSVLLALC